jgi:hypothetical protein
MAYKPDLQEEKRDIEKERKKKKQGKRKGSRLIV